MGACVNTTVCSIDIVGLADEPWADNSDALRQCESFATEQR
jgi:hypothetical protein